jgi:NADPH:quinone reductase
VIFMARIVRFHQIGKPEVLKIEILDIAPPLADEVRIQVKALGLNRAEAAFRAGRYLQQPQLPSRIGYEAAGIIEAVGSNVKNLAIGDIVSTIPVPDIGKYGVYGELATVPADYVIKHPHSLSFEEAAASWMQYLTAYGALMDIAQLKNGDYVVIPAASSSVGLAAIQLANHVGAIPIAMTRTTQKKKALEEAGAKHVIISEEEDVAERLKEITNQKGARVVFDPVGGSGVLALAEGMAKKGILFQYGSLSSEQTPFPKISASKLGLTMRGYTIFEILSDPERRKKAVDFILNLLSTGALKPLIAKTFKLDEIVQAHEYLESNQQFGKIIVTV